MNLLMKIQKTDQIVSTGDLRRLLLPTLIVPFQFLDMSMYNLVKILILLGGYEFSQPLCDREQVASSLGLCAHQQKSCY